MRKEDIINAQGHLDKEPIFEWERRGTTRFVRLFTDSDRKQQHPYTQTAMRYKQANPNTTVTVVEVECFDHKGTRVGEYDFKQTAIGHRDAKRRFYAPGVGQQHSQEVEIHTGVPLRQILRQVNGDKSFEQFYNEMLKANHDRQVASRKAEKARQQKDEQRRELAKDLTRRINSVLRNNDTHLWFVNQHGEVDINIETLSALVELAEKAKA
jgi:DNA-directed RNA polymerase subunit F